MNAQHSPEVDGRRAQSLFELGEALQAQKKSREAAEALEHAAKIYETLGPTWQSRAAEAHKMINASRRR